MVRRIPSSRLIGHDDDGGGLIATRVPILGADYCFANAAMAEFRHRHDVLSSAIVDAMTPPTRMI